MQGKTPKILVVEDDLKVSSVMVRALRPSGVGCESCGDVHTALSLATQSRLRAAVIDIGLPGPSGETLVGPLHRLFPDLPIVLITGYDPEPYYRGLQGRKNIEILEKPFDGLTLLRSLSRAGFVFEPVEVDVP